MPPFINKLKLEFMPALRDGLLKNFLQTAFELFQRNKATGRTHEGSKVKYLNK